jgi:hypothetical protein
MTVDKNDSEQALTRGSNYLNLLPKSEQNSQELECVDDSVAVGSDANGSDISLEKIGAVTESDVTGCNMNGSDNNVSAQHNTVSDNRGVTGITGTGHTINIYQYPKELTELLMKLQSNSMSNLIDICQS